ncbi:MAG: hypothetical protein H7234_04410, partial [Herminiimonas sp.]|nr:hypothetical protein [Herminiimonas sp.]
MDNRIGIPRSSAFVLSATGDTTAEARQNAGSAATGPDTLVGRSTAATWKELQALQQLPARRSPSRPVVETDTLPPGPISLDSTGHVSDFLDPDERKELRLANRDSRRTGAQRYTGIKVGRDRLLERLAPTLKGLPNVTHIRIADTRNFGDQELEAMAREDAEAGGRITHLHLQSCRALTDDGLAHLKGFTNLQSVDLQDCGSISDAGLVHLKELDGLRSLNLSTCR